MVLITVFLISSRVSYCGLFHRRHINWHSFKTRIYSSLNQQDYSSLPHRHMCSLIFLKACSAPGSSFCLPVRNAAEAGADGAPSMRADATPRRPVTCSPQLTRHGLPETPCTTERVLFQGQMAPTALFAPCQQSACSPNVQTRATVPRLSLQLFPSPRISFAFVT